MAVIDNFRGILTVFVEFKTPEGDADVLIENLKAFYQNHMTGYEGLVSVNYHKALDGKSVHNYAQWKNEDFFDAFLADKELHKALGNIGSYESNFTKSKVVFTS